MFSTISKNNKRREILNLACTSKELAVDVNHMKLKTGSRRPPQKLTTQLILDVYDAFLREYETTKIASALGVSQGTLMSWIEKYPELELAKTTAEQRRGKTSDFSNYVYQHLSPAIKKIWDEIVLWSDHANAQEKIQALLSGQPTRARQEIFIHALVSHSFNLSEACRIACVSRATVEQWKKDDYEFLQLVEEITWHKKNFFESALVDLVAMRNPGAVMFVNRTVNADRGYSEKLEVNHSGTIKQGIDIDELDLSIEVRRAILEALRKKKQSVIDVEEGTRAIEKV